MCMLEMRAEGGPSIELKRAMTAAVLQQFVMLPAGLDSSKASSAAPPLSSVLVANLAMSQSTAATRHLLLLISILTRLGTFLPGSVAPATIRAVARVVQHCESSVGVQALESCSNLELRFILDTLAQQSGRSSLSRRSPQEVRQSFLCSDECIGMCGATVGMDAVALLLKLLFLSRPRLYVSCQHLM